MKADRTTRKWIRNASDEKAAERGCRFDPERGQLVVEWVQTYCRLYEGHLAGQPMILDDWQTEATMRLFGWVRHSADWGKEIRRFRKASIWIPKKNGKTPTIAAWSLYLLMGDGEPGQKVYATAKDGRQALFAFEHGRQMVLRSPDLLDECKINNSTHAIIHLPTSSVYRVIAGDNPKSQEGLNGSVMVDETHVVDRQLMKIVSRAGISRMEPLQIEVSTAGRDPNGYGRERWQRGCEVAKGERDDLTWLHMDYSAPQDLAPEDLDADPVKYGRLANPAWGRLVREEEYLADYEASKGSLPDLADFMLYRLNIWQRSSSPWLRAADWSACRREYAEADLEGQSCWAGLDLARTRDMCAFALRFEGDEEEEYRGLCYFWLPEARVRELEGTLPQLREWERAGWLQVTPEGVTDYAYIEAEIRRLSDLFDIRELAFDPRFAPEITQRISEGAKDAAGNVIVPGTGVELVSFKQDDTNFAAPTEDYERLVIAGKLHHNGNPVLTWQAGHAQVRKTPSGVKRVVKPTADSPQTVDGVIADIMALARAQMAGGAPEPSLTILTGPRDRLGGADPFGDDDEEGW